MRRVSVCAFIAATTVAAVATAQDGANGRAAHVGVDTAFTTSPHGPTVDTFGAALRLTGDYQFENGLGLTLEGGLVSTSLRVEEEPRRRGIFPGNVLVGASFVRRLASQLAAGASLRVGAPLALYHGGIDENRLAELAYTTATAAQGFREPFVWQMNVVPVVLGGSFVLRAPRWLLLTAELTPAALVSVNQRPSRVAVGAHHDAAATQGAFSGHLGLHYFASTLPLENRERDQLAVRFGVAALLGEQRLGIDVSLGLDDPYGAFRDDPHPWWGISVVGDVVFGRPRAARP
jgi:hypothetical protein